MVLLQSLEAAGGMVQFLFLGFFFGCFYLYVGR
jgi:cbb3-type cytochrome oxidase subunit 3